MVGLSTPPGHTDDGKVEFLCLWRCFITLIVVWGVFEKHLIKPKHIEKTMIYLDG